MTDHPKRLQLKRQAGFRLPTTAVRVDRATAFGNPFRADQPDPAAHAAGCRSAAAAFRVWLTQSHPALATRFPERRATLLARLPELRGKDLACWCGPHDECHADVLIEIANGENIPTAPLPPSLPHTLPPLALSVRQPWAWAIIHAGKDVENRSWQAVNHGLRRRGRIAIHAAKGLTRDEYDDARDFMATLGVRCPEARDLARGGIIGSVEVADVVTASPSPWFFGPLGLVLRDPVPCPFVPAQGALGYFNWQPADASTVPPSAKWMATEAEAPAEPQDPQATLWRGFEMT